MSHRANTVRRAFTIVELLVVLAVVALLMALLLPSVSKARDQANRTRCLNNIRQIGMGIAVYIHDYDSLPPQLDNLSGPVYYSPSKSGLLALPTNSAFQRMNLSCPDGWASGGDSEWYDARGLSKTGSAYMDYAYWGGRYAPHDQYDVRVASFTFRVKEKGTRILVTDTVADQGASVVKSTVGVGNHGTNHLGREITVTRTDGRGKRLAATNRINATGTSVLFSDFHALWYPAEKLTQQTEGLCYPPPDQW